MTEEQLVTAVCKRAANATTRTDYATLRSREIGAPAMPEMIQVTEQQLGFSLHPLHRRLLETVGNGGFGPGDGLVGTANGSLDVEGRSLSELRGALWPNTNVTLVPLCDWGDGIWSCIDAATGSVLTMSEFGLFDIGQSFQSWLEEWVAGKNLWQQIVELGTTSIQNPHTKEYVAVPTVKGMKGERYVPSVRS
jgi:hypothetical protein